MCSKLLLLLGRTQRCGDKHLLLDLTSHSKCHHNKQATALKLIATLHVTRRRSRDHFHHRASAQPILPTCQCFLDHQPSILLQNQCTPRSALVGVVKLRRGTFPCLIAQTQALAHAAVVTPQILCLSPKGRRIASTRCKWQVLLNIPAKLLRVYLLRLLIPLRMAKIRPGLQWPYETRPLRRQQKLSLVRVKITLS